MRLFISKFRLTSKHEATVLTLVFLCAITAPAQTATAVRFKGHAIGEAAGEFYSAARMVESKGLAKDYCKVLLDNPKVMQAFNHTFLGVPVTVG